MTTKIYQTPHNREQEDDISFLTPSVPFLLFIALLLMWFFVPMLLNRIDATIGNVDQSIWLLVLLSMISFLMVCGLCWWLLQQFWLVLQLPPIEQMVSQFNSLLLWQQLSFYYASFALLLVAALGCLIAIC
ncbi:hypothetical protein ACSBL2_09945 [Pedobacter sp. AW31-3R]|uniref:hypothetical protein n=1 Tax=Pedobacter sp. AW31-3R TaxID=3445781 RepID=UPI003FA00F5F